VTGKEHRIDNRHKVESILVVMRPEASARVGMTRGHGEEYNTVRGLLGHDPGSAVGLGLSALHIWGCTVMAEEWCLY